MGQVIEFYLLWIPPILLLLALIYYIRFHCTPAPHILPTTVARPVQIGQRRASAGDTCSICLEPLNPTDFIPALACRHSFHHDCLQKWLLIRAACPLCQAVIGYEEAT